MEKRPIEHTDSRLAAILRSLEGLEYGTLQITVHDSQITQIERTERIRFPVESPEQKNSSKSWNRKKGTK